jgi:predicted porin
VQSLTARQGLTFNRAANVSLLSKDFGEVRVGRDYVATFWNYTYYDPFGTVGVGSALNVIGGSLTPFGAQNAPPGSAYPLVRTSNSIGWLSNDMSGLRLQLQMALAEQPTNCATPSTQQNTNYCYGGSGDGKSISARLNYRTQNLDAAVSMQNVSYGNVAQQAAPTLAVTVGTIVPTVGGTAGTATVGSTTAAAPFANPTAYSGNLSIFNLGGTYTMGATKLFGQFGTIRRDANVATVQQKLTHSLIGVAHTMGALTLKASYGAATRTDGTSLSTGTAGNTASNTAGFEDGARMQQTAIGAVYDLSKRTALYGTYSSNTLTAGSVSSAALRANIGFAGPAIAAGTSSTTTGLDIGIRHRL